MAHIIIRLFSPRCLDVMSIQTLAYMSHPDASFFDIPWNKIRDLLCPEFCGSDFLLSVQITEWKHLHPYICSALFVDVPQAAVPRQ